MMLDDNLRLASNDSVAQLGYNFRPIGTAIDLSIAGEVLDDTMGVFIRVTETFTEIGAGAGVCICGFSLIASTSENPDFLAGGTNDVSLGSSELMAGPALVTLAARSLPNSGEDLFFRVNPMTERALSGTNPITGLNYYTGDAHPRYLHLGFWNFPAVPGFVGAQIEMTAGRVDAWLTDRIPTIGRAKVDHRSYNS